MKRQYVTTLAFLTVFSSRGSGKSINTQKYENIIPLKAPADTLVHLMVLIIIFFPLVLCPPLLYRLFLFVTSFLEFSFLVTSFFHLQSWLTLIATPL